MLAPAVKANVNFVVQTTFATPKSKCCCSIRQEKGPGTCSILYGLVSKPALPPESPQQIGFGADCQKNNRHHSSHGIFIHTGSAGPLTQCRVDWTVRHRHGQRGVVPGGQERPLGYQRPPLPPVERFRCFQAARSAQGRKDFSSGFSGRSQRNLSRKK